MTGKKKIKTLKDTLEISSCSQRCPCFQVYFMDTKQLKVSFTHFQFFKPHIKSF